MSVRKRTLIVSRPARENLQALIAYGVNEWGEERAKSYEQRLVATLDRLISFPELGIAREDLSPGLRILSVERHRILYRVTEETVVILRILHQRLDVTAHLG